MTASEWHKIENDGDPWQPTCWLQMAHNDNDEFDRNHRCRWQNRRAHYATLEVGNGNVKPPGSEGWSSLYKRCEPGNSALLTFQLSCQALIEEQLSTISNCIIVYTLCIVYELSLGNFAAVPFVFAVFLRGFIVNEAQTQQQTISVLTCYGLYLYYLTWRPYLSPTLDNDHT